jgi:hypothetical protein
MTGIGARTALVAVTVFATSSASHVVSGFSRTLSVPSVVSGFSRTSQARPEMQRIPQFENSRAVSWKSVIPPHTESTLHRHDRYRSVIAIVGGDLKTVAPDGTATVTHYEKGKSYWFEPMAPGDMHKDVNDTNATIELVVVEIK